MSGFCPVSTERRFGAFLLPLAMFHVEHYSKNRKRKAHKGEKFMGYPNFNLTTIQLPAPTSNLTKAEYKSAYGIDLDAVDIRSFKLVVYGNEKYAIDQIKEVEGGVEIYFNGRILSITDIVQTSDEVYDVANAKPIYCHPIFCSFYRQVDEEVVTFTCLIFNNSPTVFTKDTFLTWAINLFNEIPNASIMASGYKGLRPASRLKKHPTSPTDSVAIEVVTTDASGNDYYSVNLNDMATATFIDGVNKIN